MLGLSVFDMDVPCASLMLMLLENDSRQINIRVLFDTSSGIEAGSKDMMDLFPAG